MRRPSFRRRWSSITFATGPHPRSVIPIEFSDRFPDPLSNLRRADLVNVPLPRQRPAMPIFPRAPEAVLDLRIARGRGLPELTPSERKVSCFLARGILSNERACLRVQLGPGRVRLRTIEVHLP